MRTISRLAVAALGSACLATTLLFAGCGGSSEPVGRPTATPTPTPTVSLSDLVLLMHLDEAAWTGTPGEVVDSSGLGANGKALGGATTVAPGKFGRAGSFGPESGIQIVENVNVQVTNQLTVAAWVFPKSEGNGNWRGIVAKRVDYTVKSAYTLFLDPGNHLCADINTEDDRFCITTTVGVDQWSHVALVYNGTVDPAARVLLYINGQLAGVGSESSTSIQPFDSPLWVGCLPLSGPAQSLVGLVDEVAIWHRALGAQEVQRLAAATAPLTH